MLAPQKHLFETIWGHDGARSMVPRLLASGRLPHALLLTGPDAIGKRSLAFAIAKAILSAGLPTHSVRLDSAPPARARRKVPPPDETPEPSGDLFGESAEPDLFGGAPVEPDLFGDAFGAAVPAPPPVSLVPELEAAPVPEAKPSKAKGRTKKKDDAEAVGAILAPAPAPPTALSTHAAHDSGRRSLPKIIFQGFDARVCRLVEASYPVEYDKNGRPVSQSHSDLSIIEAAGGRRGIVVDQIRFLQDIASLAPVEGAFRVVLVFGADTITQEGGNSILKLLEEPPRYLVMILVANRVTAVLPTIRSRCTIVPMAPLDRETLERKLIEEESLDRRLARVAASLSEGRPGVALRAIQAELLQRRQEVFDARRQIDRFGLPALAAAAARLQSAGTLDEVLWLLLSYTRDRMVQALASDRPELLVHCDVADLLSTAPGALHALDAEADRLIEATRLLDHPYLPNPRAALELAIWPDTV